MLALKATSNPVQSRVEAFLERSLQMYFKSDPIPQQKSQQFFEFLKSPTPLLLETNMPPSDVEIGPILEIIRRTKATRKTIFTDVDISGLRRLRHRKQREDDLRLALTEYEYRHKALFSPVRRLLPEILGIVFTKIFHNNQSDIYNIIRVCRLWKEIALSFSEFWTRLNINLSATYSKSKAFLSSIDSRLRRSQQAGLNITLIMDSTDPTTPSKEHPAFEKILKSSNRWITADFTVSEHGVYLLKRLEGRIEKLREFCLNLRPSINFAFRHTKFISISFKQSPSLRQVRLLLPNAPGVRFSLPYEQLIVYEESYSNFTSTLPSRISGSYLLTMNDLEVLQVIHHQGDDDTHLISRLSFPKLRELRITSSDLDAIYPMLISAIQNSPQPSLLKFLKFIDKWDTGYNVSFLIAVLQLTPYIQELEFSPPATIGECCQLTDFLSAPGILPNLKVLRLVDGNTAHYGPIYSTPGFMDKLTSALCERSKTSNLESLVSQDYPSPVSISIHFTSSSSAMRLDHVYGDLNAEKSLLESNESTGDSLSLFIWIQAWRCRFVTGNMSVASIERDIDRSLQALEDEINVKKLLQERVHIYLHQFTIQSQLSNLTWRDGNKGFKLQCRARLILQKWSDTVLADVPNKHWAIRGLNSLVYIPNDHVLRSTDPLQIIYGLVE